MAYNYVELSCGECGGSKHRLLAYIGTGGFWKDIKTVCCNCGTVSHLSVSPHIQLGAGRAWEGEKDDGTLCPMPWKEER